MPTGMPISVLICCANVEATLAAACESVAWADELVIVDSGSTDATAAIAQRYADRYVLEPWRGYTAQKVFAVELCRNDWILILDGDEEVSPTLAKEIAVLNPSELDRYDVLKTPRQTFLLGHAPRAWWPDWQDRLFHRRRCVWADEVLHDHRDASHPLRVKRLPGPLWHRRGSAASFNELFAGGQEERRALMVAMQMYRRGRRCRWMDLALRPNMARFKSLILKRGLLDGTLGLIVAKKAATLTMLKYAALWTIQNDKLSHAEKETLAKIFDQPSGAQSARNPAK